MTCASVAHSLCWPGLACLPSPSFPQLARNERVGTSARWGILPNYLVCPRDSQVLGTRLFPAPPWSIPVCSFGQRSGSDQQSGSSETTSHYIVHTQYRSVVTGPLLAPDSSLRHHIKCYVSTPNTDFSAYHPGPAVNCPPVFCALKCHTTNNVSEAGLMWPNEETQACDRIVGGGRDAGLPTFRAPAPQTRCSRWRRGRSQLGSVLQADRSDVV